MRDFFKSKFFILLSSAMMVLSTAVAGSSVQKLSSKDMDVLVRTVVGEALNQGGLGMQAVAEVILNRVRDSRYPNTVRDVCLQAKQFSCWNPRDLNLPKIRGLSPQSRFYRMAKMAVDKALYARRVLPENVTHFHTKAVSPKWARNKRPVAKIKQHMFYSA